MDWTALVPFLAVVGVFGVMAGVPIYLSRRHRVRESGNAPPPVVDRVGSADGQIYERGWRVDDDVMPLDNGEFPPARG